MPPSPIQGYDSPDSPSETDSAPSPEDSTSDSSTDKQATGNESPSDTSGGSRTGPDGVITFDPLPRQSIRTALILDRFSMSCPINYCSNDSFLSTTQIMGRPFFDFVAKRDEALVRSWIDAVKGWGVNERGQPSDGGFGFGKFHLFPRGRDSVYVILPDLPRRAGCITHFYICTIVSDWSQNLHSRKRAMGVRPLAAVRRVLSLIPHGRQSPIPPHLYRRAQGNNDRVLRRTILKTRSSLMLYSLPTRTALWSFCDTPPHPLAWLSLLSRLSQLLRQYVLRNRSRLSLHQNDFLPNLHFKKFILFFLGSHVCSFLHLLLCTT